MKRDLLCERVLEMFITEVLVERIPRGEHQFTERALDFESLVRHDLLLLLLWLLGMQLMLMQCFYAVGELSLPM